MQALEPRLEALFLECKRLVEGKHPAGEAIESRRVQTEASWRRLGEACAEKRKRLEQASEGVSFLRSCHDVRTGLEDANRTLQRLLHAPAVVHLLELHERPANEIVAGVFSRINYCTDIYMVSTCSSR